MFDKNSGGKLRLLSVLSAITIIAFFFASCQKQTDSIDLMKSKSDYEAMLKKEVNGLFSQHCAGYATGAWNAVTGQSIEGGLITTPRDVVDWMNDQSN